MAATLKAQQSASFARTASRRPIPAVHAVPLVNKARCNSGARMPRTRTALVKAMNPATAPVQAAAAPKTRIWSTKLLDNAAKLLAGFVLMVMFGSALMPAVGKLMSQHPDVLEVERAFLTQRSWARRMVAIQAQLRGIEPTAAPTRGMVFNQAALMEQLDSAKYNYLLYGLLVLAHQGLVAGALPQVSDPVLERAARQGHITFEATYQANVAVAPVLSDGPFWQSPEAKVSELKDNIRLEEIAVQQGISRVASLRHKHDQLVKSMPICPTGKTMGTLISSGQQVVQAEADLIRHTLILEQLQSGQTYIHSSAIDARVRKVLRKLHQAA